MWWRREKAWWQDYKQKQREDEERKKKKKMMMMMKKKTEGHTKKFKCMRVYKKFQKHDGIQSNFEISKGISDHRNFKSLSATNKISKN